MSNSSEFSFGSDSVASAYDDVLVPILFQPWAEALIQANGPWNGRAVLDIATGTGIVARLLAPQLGKSGSVLGTDLNGEMLKVAAASMRDESQNVRFVECPAENLKCADKIIDYVICQQGFQFFTDKVASAQEIHRVLKENGTAIVSVWRAVAECHFFSTICKTLESIGEREIAGMMGAPFKFLSKEFETVFKSAEFSLVEVHSEERDLVMSGGVEQAIKAAYATPIGPKLRSLTQEIQARFVRVFSENINQLSADGVSMGQMVSDVLIARKMG